MPSFDIFVIGSGGGPAETNLSGYLLKPYGSTWDRGVIALEGGSGIGALAGLFRENPDVLHDFRASTPSEPMAKAAKLYEGVESYLITHAHLDHICSMVLSAGTVPGPTRRLVFARQSVLLDVATVFEGRIWPPLASWAEDDPTFMYRYQALNADYTRISDGLSVLAMPVSHGKGYPTRVKACESTAFFIRSNITLKEFLFFGDVEPDSLSTDPRTAAVWKHAAAMIPDRLDTIFLECSFPSSQPTSLLYGHLSPPHVMAELRSLASMVTAARYATTSDVGVEWSSVLAGVTLVVTHCKEQLQASDDGQSVRDCIVAELALLEKNENLGLTIVAATPGMRFGEFTFLNRT